jgi:hypothetical protein
MSHHQTLPPSFFYRQTGGADGGRGIGCRCILPDSWLRTRPPYQWSVFRVGEIEVLSERADFEFKFENTCVCAAFLRITGLLFLLLLYSLMGLCHSCVCVLVFCVSTDRALGRETACLIVSYFRQYNIPAMELFISNLSFSVHHVSNIF